MAKSVVVHRSHKMCSVCIVWALVVQQDRAKRSPKANISTCLQSERSQPGCVPDVKQQAGPPHPDDHCPFQVNVYELVLSWNAGSVCQDSTG